MSPSQDFPAPDLFTAGTVGPIGQRVFYLQARQGDVLLTLKTEKEQVGALAEYLAELLEKLGGPTSGVAPSPELAEPIGRADLVIFVDAAVDLPSGRTKVGVVLPSAPEAQSMAHDFGPGQLLAVAQRLYGRQPEAWSMSVGGEFWGYREGLSPQLDRIVPRLLHQIELLIAARVSGEAHHA